MSEATQNPDKQDYDNPWKLALDDYLDEFMLFYFPDIYHKIDWTEGYQSLDTEFQAVVRDADLGNQRADKLVKVITSDVKSEIVYIHIEVQSQKDNDFERRMFTYNYRIFDKYGQFPVSLAVLADENKHWKPNAHHFEQWGFVSHTSFPTVKLLDYADRLEELQASDNAFAILTAAHILTKRTHKNPKDRYAAKFTVTRLLYRNGWDKQKVINFFRVIDWLMKLPLDLTINFKKELNQLEEEQQMRYVTSIEQLAMAEGMQVGMQVGEQRGRQEGRSGGMIEMFLNMLNMRFPSFDVQAYKDKVVAYSDQKLTEYALRISTAKTPEEVFADDDN
jgi:hypothetical protein